jgi:hypothetical protein
MPLPKRIGADTIAFVTAKINDTSDKTLADELGELRYLAMRFDTPRLLRALDYVDRLTAAGHRLLREHVLDEEYEEIREILMSLQRPVGK